MANSRTESIRKLYDERSETYGNALHTRLAQDYIRYAELKEGEMILDLACGTGLVSLPARIDVGRSGVVAGIDVSEGMLGVARRKAQQEQLSIDFINHNVSELDGLRLQGFDVITCAAALILLENPVEAVMDWKSLLCPGGRLLTEVQTESANITMNILADIGPELGIPLPWDMHRWKADHALDELPTAAGFVVERRFRLKPYEESILHVDSASVLFEKAVTTPMFKNSIKSQLDRKPRTFSF